MARGKVTQWNGKTGFLVDDSDNESVFFGDRALRGIRGTDIQRGMVLEFDRQQSDRGPKAANVRSSTSVPTAAGMQATSIAQPPVIRGPRVLNFEQAAPTTWVLPRLTQKVISDVRLEERHPVIQLDRLSIPGNQEKQRDELEKATSTWRSDTFLADLAERRTAVLNALVPPDRAEAWAQTTAGPMTLHLSRANVLENAGISLHAVYGFAFLPGSGLKGVARAAAVTLLKFPEERVIEIFGNEPGEARDGKQYAGNVCFHDAWPVKWPRLFVDIVNNHHPKYYDGKDAPGDWESPNPVNFLAITPGTTFSFRVTASRRDTPVDIVRDAASCLQAALSQSGAGAKTAAGYGWFLPPAAQEIRSSTLSRITPSLKFTLKLESPAFLAGSAQQKEDCDLRSATLRGQFRAWWRTLHSGFLKTEQLRQLEGALWGDTTQGAAIRFHVVPKKRPNIRLHEHPGDRESGLKYLAYGMDERSRGQRKQRWVADAGAEWELEVRFAESHFFASTKKNGSDTRIGVLISEELVRQQFHAALWLLTRYGGVGSKGRKGFGSLSVNESLSIETISQLNALAAGLREQLGLGISFSATLAESPALFHPGSIIKEFEVSARSGAEAIEAAGRAYAKTASEFKHNPEKVSLGLPRKIHGPMNEPLRHQNTASHERPQFLDTVKRTGGKPDDARYASPVQMHVKELSTGKWLVRVVAMPARYLPSDAASAGFLKKFTDSFGAVIQARSTVMPRAGNRLQPSQTQQSTQGYERVEVSILEIKQVGNRAQLKVQELGKEKPGMLIDGTPPATLPAVGETVTVYRSTTSNPSSPRYRWDLPKPPSNDSKRKHH